MFKSDNYKQSLAEKLTIDEKVKKFLSDHARDWYEMNIPASDGKLVYYQNVPTR